MQCHPERVASQHDACWRLRNGWRLHLAAGTLLMLGDVPLADLTREVLRQQIAVVTQDVFLFHASLRDNIAFGAPGATPDELAAAVNAAQLHDLIERLPDGLATVVGERGFRLSGGEKQRVSIARALLRQAPYLHLDEASSPPMRSRTRRSSRQPEISGFGPAAP